MSLGSDRKRVTSMLVVCIFAFLPMPTPDASSSAADAAGVVLERARRVRNIGALGELRARSLRLEFSYAASWALNAPGRRTVEIRRPGTFVTREFYPWQRLDTAVTELDALSFRRSYGQRGKLRDGVNAAAESNGRAEALREWMTIFHEAPNWGDLTVTSISSEDAAATPGFDLVRVRGARLQEMHLAFDRKSGLLVRIASPPDRKARREAVFSNYRAFQGVLFATRTEVRLIGPRTSADAKFIAVLERVSF